MTVSTSSFTEAEHLLSSQGCHFVLVLLESVDLHKGPGLTQEPNSSIRSALSFGFKFFKETANRHFQLKKRGTSSPKRQLIETRSVA